ncbi:MAG: family 1 encapsulin nanocompartment shell protein [Desulfurococcaceae archaeon]|nr:encapsulin [Sulfolobales archaeon]MDW8170682.1 family 1 encapsulin nanocompartment shell protein [Desulfurococcaceae archaeon]
MLSKHPFEIPPERKLTKNEVTDALRLSIIAELDAISLYLQLARSIDDERVKKVFEDIAREEKTHVGEFLALLKELDPQQVEELEKGEREVKELAGESSTASASNNARQSFEELVSKEVRKTLSNARLISKKLPLLKLGRGVEAVPFESIINGKVERGVLPLSEASAKFRVLQRAIDYAQKTGQVLEMPDAHRAALEVALSEDKCITESLIGCKNALKIPLSNWDEPGASVIDVAKAVNELLKTGVRRPIILFINPTRYVKLLSVSEKTGVTDLERVKMLVDEVVSTTTLPIDKAVVISSTPEVLDVVYGGDAEVDHIGPEDGYQVFRVWSAIGVRIRDPRGIVILEGTSSEQH